MHKGNVFVLAGGLLIGCSGTNWKHTNPHETVQVPLGDWKAEEISTCEEATPPRLVSSPPPRFPNTWGQATPWGRVILSGQIQTDGSVGSIEVFSADEGRLTGPSISAFKLWRFQPAQCKGVPVAVHVHVAFEYRKDSLSISLNPPISAQPQKAAEASSSDRRAAESSHTEETRPESRDARLQLPPRAEAPLAEMIPLTGEAGSVHALLLKQEWGKARARAAALVQKVAENGKADPRQSAAALALLALADAGSEGRSASCYWHAAQSLYGDLDHATLAAYGTAGSLLEESSSWRRNEEILSVGSSPGRETVLRPEKISGRVPEYTLKDRLARVQGVIVTETVVDKEGRVTQIRLLKGLSPGLDLKTLATICEWRFRPATSGGRPVKVYYTLTTSFAVS